MAETCDVSFEDSSEDCEPVQFYDAKVVTARKAHRCTECGAAIALGDQYLRKSYRFEGKFETDRVCDPCREAAGEFQFTLIGGMLWESFADEWDNGAHLQACLNRLASARAKAHMRDQWLKWQELRAAQRQRAVERRKKLDAVGQRGENPT